MKSYWPSLGHIYAGRIHSTLSDSQRCTPPRGVESRAEFLVDMQKPCPRNSVRQYPALSPTRTTSPCQASSSSVHPQYHPITTILRMVALQYQHHTCHDAQPRRSTTHTPDHCPSLSPDPPCRADKRGMPAYPTIPRSCTPRMSALPPTRPQIPNPDTCTPPLWPGVTAASVWGSSTPPVPAHQAPAHAPPPPRCAEQLA